MKGGRGGMRVWAKLVATAAFTALLGAPAAAQVPDPYARDLAGQLARAEQGLRQGGYSRAAGPFAAGLGQRERRRFTLTLRAGQDYRIVGVCDVNCGDVELRLLDPNDVQIARDIGALQVRPGFTGAYVVDVGLLGCAEARCWNAVNVYSR